MSVNSLLVAGQSAAESLMTDTVTVRYATGTTTQDPVTGSETPVYADRFTSRCKVQTRTLQARQEEVGGRTATTVTVELHLPISTPAVEVGDLCEITAVGALSDVQLLGRTFRVVAPVAKSFATARRLDVEEMTS
jgi:septal ring-binding cell division protein DamX